MLFRETVKIAFFFPFCFPPPTFSFNKSTLKVFIFCLMVCLVKTFPLNSHEFWASFHIRKRFHLLSLGEQLHDHHKSREKLQVYGETRCCHLVGGFSTGREDFCVWAVDTGHIHTLIQWKIRDHHGSCLCCAAWWRRERLNKALSPEA